MLPRILAGLAVAVCVWPGRTALAQPENDQIDQTVTDAEDVPVKEKSYFVPAAEVLIWNLTVSLSARAAGMPWADTNVSIMEDHLRGGWELDQDAYSTNQLGHPLSGSFTFSMARSAGQGFWVSSLYSLGSSTLWELFAENTNPSINDMITTPIGGMFIGEAMHRFGRALLY